MPSRPCRYTPQKPAACPALAARPLELAPWEWELLLSPRRLGPADGFLAQNPGFNRLLGPILGHAGVQAPLGFIECFLGIQVRFFGYVVGFLHARHRALDFGFHVLRLVF